MTLTATGPDRPRDGKGKWIKGADSMGRDAEALRLRAKNWTHQAIAEHLGYGDEANVRRAIRKATAEVQVPAVNEYRVQMDLQLDELERRVQAVLDARHLVFYQGEAVTHDGNVVVDDGPVLAAVRELRAIQERRARLWGTDAPVRAEVESSAVVRYVVDGVDLSKLT